MSVKWMGWVFDESPLSGKAQVLHLAMASYANDDGKFFASYADLGAKAKCTKQHVQTVVSQMVRDGLLEVLEKGSTKGRATVYRLLGPYNSLAQTDRVTVQLEPATVQLEPSDGTNLHEHNVLDNELHNGQALLVAEVVVTGPSFEDFYAVYPRRMKPGDAEKAWKQMLREGHDPQVIVEGARRFAADPNLPEKQFVPYPATWLRAKSWMDEPLPARGSAAPRVTAFMEQQAKFAAMDAAERRELGA